LPIALIEAEGFEDVADALQEPRAGRPPCLDLGAQFSPILGKKLALLVLFPAQEEGGERVVE
jgi:hypothetical protein